MKILITGGSGFLGLAVSRALEQAGHELVSLSRRTGVDLRSLQSASGWLPFLSEVDAVINCAGIITEADGNEFAVIHTLGPIALFDACVTQGVRRVIQISALGVDHASPTPYQQSKCLADRHLQSLPLDWLILRPSLVYGPDGSSTRFFTHLANLPLVPLIDGGRQCVQPVHVDDVVAAVLQCLQVKATHQVINVVGPHSYTFAQWLNRLRQRSGKPITLTIPYALARVMAFLMAPMLPLMSPDNLRMLQQGNCADMQRFCKLLGRKPHVVP